MKYKAAGKKPQKKKNWRILDWVFVATFVVLPFVVSLSGMDKFRLPKDVFLELAILLILGIVLVTRRVRIPIRLDLWNWLLLVAVVFLLLHTLFISPTQQSVSGCTTVLSYLILLTVLTPLVTETFQKRLWLAAGLAMSLNAILTVLQYMGWFSLMQRPEGDILSGRLTPAGFIGEVNSGGLLFALFCLISLYGVVQGEDSRIRLLWTVILACNLVGLAFTRTLTALAALGICLILWIVLHHWWVLKKKGGSLRQLRTFWLSLATGVVFGGLAVYASGVSERVLTVAGQVSRGDWNVATAGRQPVYQITWKMIWEDPVLGKGLNSFGRDFFSSRANTDYGRSLKMVNQPGAFRQVHNEYLQVWEELGIIGLVLFLSLAVIPLVSAFRRMLILEEPDRVYWLGILCLGWLLLLVGSLTFFPFHVSVTAAFGILLLANLRSFEPDRTGDSADLEDRLPDFVQVKWVRIVLVTAMLIPLAVSGMRKWMANDEMAVAAFLLQNAQSAASGSRQSRVFADEALNRLGRAERLYDSLVEIYNLRGSALMLLGRAEDAADAYLKAARLLPSPEIYTNLGAALMADGSEDEARPYLEAALRYNPDFEPARQALEFLEKGRR